MHAFGRSVRQPHDLKPEVLCANVVVCLNSEVIKALHSVAGPPSFGMK